MQQIEQVFWDTGGDTLESETKDDHNYKENGNESRQFE